MSPASRGGLAGPVSGGAEAQAPWPARDRRTDTGPPTDPLTRDLLDGLAEAIVVVDTSGIVLVGNAAAEQLLPEIAVGTAVGMAAVPWLARALSSEAGAFDGEHRGRRLRGVRRRLAGGQHIWHVRDVTEEQARTDALLTERSRSAFLAEASNRLGLSLNRQQTLRTAVTLPVPFLADGVAIVHRPAGNRTGWTRFFAGDPAVVEGTAETARLAAVPSLAEALAGDRTEANPWLTAELADLGWLAPEGFGRAGTVLVAPVPGPGEPAGALVAVRAAGRAGFDEPEVALVRQYASRAGAALATSALYAEQTSLARVLQASLLPPELPAMHGVLLAGGYRAARETMRIGGDFYDAFETDDGGTFALGDVCGKGVEAAVLTGRVRQSLHTLRMIEDRPVRLLELLNRTLITAPEAARKAQFTTILAGTCAPHPQGGLRVRVAGGGHPSPLIARTGGCVEVLPVGGMPVGALPAARFREVGLHLAPGDVMVAYTDGITEARGGPTGGEMFGETRLRHALESCVGMPPGAIVERLLQLVDQWLDGHDHDDIALLVLRAPQPRPSGLPR